ncbi:MAG: D-TA family PLP-dependent enzyme [Sphingobacterium sp.]
MMKQWYEVANVDHIDSPALLVYPERITYNIRLLKKMVSEDTNRLRPHVKTNKMIEVCKMMMDAGIEQFKCSTIAEAEMLALSNAKDVMMAYQPVGPKIERWMKLVQAYPNTHFSCLLDNVDSIRELGFIAQNRKMNLSVYVDIDLGMGRTGSSVDQIERLLQCIKEQKHLVLEGVHGYDGHISNSDPEVREKESGVAYVLLKAAFDYLQPRCPYPLKMVIGGSPSFTSHAKRKDVTCSPGTFIFWDWGYRSRIPEQAFEYAAVLLMRVISVLDGRHVCVDLGYKAVASDPPLQRVLFLNADDATTVFQSEEHLVLSVGDSKRYPIGAVLYAIPTHICPTVALYDRTYVIQEHQSIATWQVIGRNRILNI